MGFNGKLIVKEYPTATANVNHFRHLLEELKLKKKFKPDIVFIDYLNKAGWRVHDIFIVFTFSTELSFIYRALD